MLSDFRNTLGNDNIYYFFFRLSFLEINPVDNETAKTVSKDPIPLSPVFGAEVVLYEELLSESEEEELLELPEEYELFELPEE